MPGNTGPRFTEPERVDQRNQALRYWMTGATYHEIADRLDVSYGTAYTRVQQAIDNSRPHADYDRYRATQLAELEMARQALRRVIVDPAADTAGLVAAIGALIKLQEREAKLVGLDRVPTPHDELAGMTDEQLAAIAAEWADEFAAADR